MSHTTASELGLTIFFLGLFASYLACLASWYFLTPHWGVFEGTAVYIFVLISIALLLAIILRMLGF